MSIDEHSARTEFLAYIEVSLLTSSVSLSTEGYSKSICFIHFCVEDQAFSSSFGGYDTIRDTFLVGSLQGNFLASFAVGWACTTVSEGSTDVTGLSVEQF